MRRIGGRNELQGMISPRGEDRIGKRDCTHLQEPHHMCPLLEDMNECGHHRYGRRGLRWRLPGGRSVERGEGSDPDLRVGLQSLRMPGRDVSA